MKNKTLFLILLFPLIFCQQQKDKTITRYGNFKLFGIINGVKENGFFGHSIISLGDLNNDGGEEIMIGADGDGTDMQGKIYFFQSVDIKDTISADNAYLHLQGIYKNDRMGWVLDAGTDISGDGIPDLVVGAIGCQMKGTMSGGIYILCGKRENNTVIYKQVNSMLYGESTNNSFGWSVNTHGDINNDGINDIIIGAPGYNDNTGRAYIFYGKNMPDMVAASDADIIISGENKGDYFGNSVTALKDLNSDNKNDLLITAFMNSDADENAGKAYIFYNKNFEKNVQSFDADVIISGEYPGDWFGESSAAAGDVNNDGREDLLIGAGGSDLFYNEGGAVYVFRSGFNRKKNSANEADMTLSGLIDGAKLGSFILAPGDIDKDNKPDVLVGATCGDYSDLEGRVYFYANDRLVIEKQTAQPNKIIRGIKGGSRFGNSICAADIDGDGLKEIFIGAYYDSTIGKNFGRVYIYKLEK